MLLACVTGGACKRRRALQGATTPRAHAREEEQHGLKACQRAAARLNRVCGVLTQAVRVVVGTNLNVPAVSPAAVSGQSGF